MCFLLMILSNEIEEIKVLNGYEIRFCSKDCILLIEAKNTFTSKLYSVNISKSEIGMITGELFSEIKLLKKTFEIWIALKEVELDPITIIQTNFETLKDMIHQKENLSTPE